jgi:hypothetical protein
MLDIKADQRLNKRHGDGRQYVWNVAWIKRLISVVSWPCKFVSNIQRKAISDILDDIATLLTANYHIPGGPMHLKNGVGAVS